MAFLRKQYFVDCLPYTQGESPEKLPVMWRENEGHYGYFWVRFALEMYNNVILQYISEHDGLWEFTLGIKDLVQMIFGGQICTNV